MTELELSIPPLPRYAATARLALARFGSTHRVAQTDVENLVFAVGEAVANAIAHARTAKAIHLRFCLNGTKIVATITDDGRGFQSPSRDEIEVPNVFAEEGRGFAIMQRCTDFLHVDSRPGGGTVVTLGRRLSSQEPQAVS
ncbi:MAG: ATP-binding protein [Candidatus Eremiobacteraeota bacterium]|nr:ATP-binding protein [Candidatus Eremiobacteraeota bacterium]MBV9263588.1 ATP-binding protein [Candidatus Eremiobacteraeota bacterium]